MPYRSKKVLVVEDDAIQADCLASFLRREGMVARSVLNGHAALSLLAVEQWDLLVIDVYMPGIDGIQLVRMLRQQEKTKNLLVFMVTAASALKVIDTAGGMEELHPCKIIEKPFEPDKLVEDIKSKLTEISHENKQPCQDGFNVDLSGSTHHGSAGSVGRRCETDSKDESYGV